MFSRLSIVPEVSFWNGPNKSVCCPYYEEDFSVPEVSFRVHLFVVTHRIPFRELPFLPLINQSRAAKNCLQ
jgi:hypothetical protein